MVAFGVFDGGCRGENAIKRGDVQGVRYLLDRGADVDARDRHGETALMLAAHAGHREVVAALIAHRSYPEHHGQGGL